MAITFQRGDLFEIEADAIVNTVNCVGVMGKGVALEFKRRWPKNYLAYKRLCESKSLRPGKLFIYEQVDLLDSNGPRFLVNFPTKDHWRSKSKIEYISEGLDALRHELELGAIKSIAMPPLGCGNGGLEWPIVRALIDEKLKGLDANIVVLEPFVERDKLEHTDGASLELTFPRATLLKCLGDLEPIFGGGFDRLSLQKIVYFLQELGVPFGLNFSRNRYGPYSEKLKVAFAALEKQGAMKGFSEEEQMSHVTKAGYAAADDFLQINSKDFEAGNTITKLSHLIQGYESPYGLELLSTVHHLHAKENIHSIDAVVSAFHSWSELKKEKFSDSAIKNAYHRLSVDGLMHPNQG